MNWQIKSLDEVCTKITDGAHQSPKTVDSGKPMASVKDLTRFGVDLSEARKISIEDFERLVKQGCQPQVGDVLIAKDGNSALDTVCNIKQPLDAVLLSSVAILRPNLNVLDSDFLKYYLSSKDVVDYFKSNFISGAAIPRVVLRDFRKAQIHLPELKIQKRIAKILSTLDDKIHLNDQLNQTLESIAQAIFKSWFIDFEPVRAKIAAKQEGKDPEFAAMCAISGKTQTELEQMAKEDFAELQATAALFPDELVESELGDVPKGWEVKEASSIFNISIGKTPPRKEPYWFSNYSDDIKWLSIKDMGNNGLFTKETSEYLTHQAIAKFNIKVLPRNTVLLSFKLTVGRVVISNSEITTNEAIAHFFSDKIPYFWTYLYLRNFDFSKLGSTSSIATAINSKIIKDMPFLVVDTMILRVFEKNVSTFFETIRNNEVQNSNLMNVRDTLLPKLLSGEVSLDMV